MAQIKGAMEAKKHAYRQTQDGVVISFTVHPSDVSPELAAAPLGTVFMIGYAEVVEGKEAPAAPAQPEEPAKERRPLHTLSLPQQAGILANDTRFQIWCCGMQGADLAASWIRGECGVNSRSEIIEGTKEADKFLALVERYRIETGQMAAPR